MKKRFCDLNVMELPSIDENLKNIKQLMKLGYNVIAINRKLKALEKVNKRTPKPSHADIHSFTNLMTKLKAEIATLKELPGLDFVIPDDFELLSRVTIDLESSEQIRLLKHTPYKEILDNADIISIIPENEMIFKVIAEGKVDCDIIALQLGNALEFKATREMMGIATAKHIAFEICYSHAIKSISLRKYIFKNGRDVVQRSKKARGIIMCSHGEHPLDFRSPLDVINLAHLFDINDTVCYDVVSKNCLEVISHAKLRKLTFKGAVAVEEILDEEEIPAAKKQKIEWESI